MSSSVIVKALPGCDICRSEGVTKSAKYDGKTIMGPWANMCLTHFKGYGVGLGTGRGQRLVLAGE